MVFVYLYFASLATQHGVGELESCSIHTIYLDNVHDNNYITTYVDERQSTSSHFRSDFTSRE